MKQLLLRVSDDLHRRLTARAAREGRSVNALASEILDAAADADAADRQAQLRAKAAELGMLVTLHDIEPISEQEYWATIEATRGLGPFIDEFLAQERDP